MRTIEELLANEAPFMEWWNNLSHTKKRTLIGYKEITTTVFNELPKRLQLATFDHWAYWYSSGLDTKCED